MKRKFWNWIRNEGASERTLFLNGEISDETWFGDEVTPGIFRDELESGSGDVTVWINSPGGDVFAASQIYSMLRDYKGAVNIRIDALAASAASVIAMAGDKVSMNPTGLLMVHDPMMFAAGNTRDMEKAIDILNEVKETIINAYADKTGLSRKKISELMSDETWMNARKAKDLGFIDEILFSDEAAPRDEAEPEVEEAGEPLIPVAKKEIPATDVLYSRRAVEDSLLAKLTEKEPRNDGIPITDLDKRLSLLSH